MILISNSLIIIAMFFCLDNNGDPSEVSSSSEKGFDHQKLITNVTPWFLVGTPTIDNFLKPAPSEQRSGVDPMTIPFNKTSPVLELKTGEALNYKGIVLMKIEENSLINDDEIRFIEERWNIEVKNFIIHDLGMGELAFQDYMEAKRSSFQAYDALIEPIQSEIRQKFGTQLQLIHGEDLWKLYDTSWMSYRDKLTKILNSGGLVRLEEFQNDYQEWVYQKFDVGWNDIR